MKNMKRSLCFLDFFPFPFWCNFFHFLVLCSFSLWSRLYFHAIFELGSTSILFFSFPFFFPFWCTLFHFWCCVHFFFENFLNPKPYILQQNVNEFTSCSKLYLTYVIGGHGVNLYVAKDFNVLFKRNLYNAKI